MSPAPERHYWLIENAADRPAPSLATIGDGENRRLTIYTSLEKAEAAILRHPAKGSDHQGDWQPCKVSAIGLQTVLEHGIFRGISLLCR